jgi:adenosylcobinamide-phosphate guanylyltransferase
LDAVVMAGGKGTRLKMGEKPMVKILGRHLIERVVLALEDSSIERIAVAVTDSVPATRQWAKDRGLEVLDTSGKGFVADMVEAVQKAGVKGSVMVIMADLPLINPELIDYIMEIYREMQKPALSTHTPLSLHSKLGRRPDSLFNYQGQLIVPSGVNVLNGSKIEEEQEDYHLILERIELAVNVNTAEDLKLCESILGDIA